MSTESVKLPPHNIDAEDAVIGSLIIGGDVNELTLNPVDFYHEVNQWIYKACQDMGKTHIPVNEITLSEKLNTMEKLEAIGGVAYISHLVSICPNYLDMAYYADIVQKLSIYRQMITLGQRVETIGYEAKGELQVNLNAIDDMLLALRKRTGNIPILSPKDVVDLAMARYNSLHNEEFGAGIPTGLRDVDELLGGGLYRGEMAIVAGRPGMGKTEFCLNVASSAGVRGNVLFCSAEMPIEGLVDRVVAGQLGISIHEIRKGKYSQELYDRIIYEPMAVIRESNIYYYHDLPMTTSKILQAVVSMKVRYGVVLVVIDYLGILDDEYGSSGYERVGYISRKVKQIARVMDIPVLVAHQLNREVEHAQDKRPQLKDLRDSGKLEEDADVVLLLYRDSYYDDKTNSSETEVIVAKHRQGESNQIVGVYYDKEKRRYQDLAREGYGNENLR